MTDTHRDIDFLIFHTGYTSRMIKNFEEYQRKINEKNPSFHLCGLLVDDVWKLPEDPFYYPKDNNDFLEKLKIEVNKLIVTNGCIVMKNKYKKEVDDTILSEIIEECNDFCAFFDVGSLIERIVQTIRIGDENINILLLDFDTESG